MELGITQPTSIHNTRSLIRILKYILDILQTEEALTVKEYKHTQTHNISKLGFQKKLRLVRLIEEICFPLVYNHTSQEGLIYLLLNISQANSMESQIFNKLHPGEWPTSLTRKNDPREWATRPTWSTRFSTLLSTNYIIKYLKYFIFNSEHFTTLVIYTIFAYY